MKNPRRDGGDWVAGAGIGLLERGSALGNQAVMPSPLPEASEPVADELVFEPESEDEEPEEPSESEDPPLPLEDEPPGMPPCPP